MIKLILSRGKIIDDKEKNDYISLNHKTKYMIELSKKILTKVSFDRILFQKELNKAIHWISDTKELQDFKDWCIIEFGHLYPSIVRKAFKKVN